MSPSLVMASYSTSSEELHSVEELAEAVDGFSAKHINDVADAIDILNIIDRIKTNIFFILSYPFH